MPYEAHAARNARAEVGLQVAMGVGCAQAEEDAGDPPDGELEPEPTTSEDADADAHKHAATTLRRVVEIQSEFWKLDPPCDA